MPAIELNITQWPVCFVHISGSPTPTEYERHIAEFNRLYERRAPFSVVTWLQSYRSDPAIVRRTGRWFAETDSLIREFWVSNAVLSQSAGFRFLLSAVFLIKPLAAANKVCASPAETLEFTRQTWRERHLVLPNSLRWPFAVASDASLRI
jgi:hypothetical protein